MLGGNSNLHATVLQLLLSSTPLWWAFNSVHSFLYVSSDRVNLLSSLDIMEEMKSITSSANFVFPDNVINLICCHSCHL